MIQLSRETRYALVPQQRVATPKPVNSWAGWPSSNLLVPHLVLQLVVRGQPHPVTGYLCNIKIIDDLLREVVMRRLIPVYDGHQTAEQILRIAFREVLAGWPDAVRLSDAHAADPPPVIQSLTLHMTPQLRYTIHHSKIGRSGESMNNPTTDPHAPDVEPQRHVVELTEQFEFSAAHRLHCGDLGEEENQRLFGKCNNPEGHGHNYVVEVTVSASVDSDRGQVLPLHDFESIVDRVVIDRLDHKHLNRDVEHFASVNPSVENIAKAIYQWLDGQFGSAKLEQVKVFETPKTWAVFAGG